MSSTGSSHCRQYIVSLLWRALAEALCGTDTVQTRVVGGLDGWMRMLQTQDGDGGGQTLADGKMWESRPTRQSWDDGGTGQRSQMLSGHPWRQQRTEK